MRVVALLLTGWMCGCAAGDAATHAVVRDSAGVRIVENDLTAELPRYAIGEGALVEIGAVEGAEPYLLDNVETARWLGDGSIAVLNGGTGEVRVFDDGGRFVRAYGRHGGGPGEYRTPLDVWQHGDSLVVMDFGRIVVTSLADGSARATAPASLPGRPYFSESWFGAGAFVIPVRHGAPEEVGQWRDIAIDYVRVSLDGSRVDTIVRVAGGREGLVQLNVGEGIRAVTITPPLFAGRARATVHDSRLFAGVSLERRIVEYDSAGRPIHDIRWTSPGEPVTAGLLETYIAARAGASRTTREGIEALERTDTFPHFDGLLTDAEGRLWMRSYDLPGQTTLPYWTVFDTAGIAEAVVEMPRGIQLYEVRRDRVLGMREDSVGVQHVVVLPIRRGG